MKKKVSISVYLVFGGIGLFFIGLIFLGLYSQWFSNPVRALLDDMNSFNRAWIPVISSLLVVITGTIWGFVDWMRTRTHKRKSQTDPAYADQTEPPPAHGIIAFWVGFIFIVGCAIAFVMVLLIAGAFVGLEVFKGLPAHLLEVFKGQIPN
jgi:uncharacterized membrane protein